MPRRCLLTINDSCDLSESPAPSCLLGCRARRTSSLARAQTAPGSVLASMGALPPRPPFIDHSQEKETRAMSPCRPGPPCGSSNPLGRMFRKNARTSESPAPFDWWNVDPCKGTLQGGRQDSEPSARYRDPCEPRFSGESSGVSIVPLPISLGLAIK